MKSTHTSKRLLMRCCLALTAGMVLTALFAWGPTLLARRWSFATVVGTNYAFTYNGVEFSGRSLTSYPAWLGTRLDILTPARGQGVAPVTTKPAEIALAQTVLETDLRVLGPMTGDPFSRPGLEMTLHTAGFPLRNVAGTSLAIWRRALTATEETNDLIALDIPPGWTRGLAPRFLPIGIRVVPTVINFAAWTILWFATATCIRALSHYLRRRPGSCRACGYDRRGTPALPCPECGDTSPPIPTTPRQADSRHAA